MGETTQAKIFEAFGFREEAERAAQNEAKQSDEGGNTQEVAEPAQAEAKTVAEASEGIRSEDQKDGAEGAQSAAASGGQGGEAQPQSEQERRENAARRRRQEQQAAVEQAVAQARQDMQVQQEAAWQQFFETAGFVNSVTNQPIRTKEEYDAWQADFAQQQLQEQLKNGELTQEVLQQVISQNPIVQQAQRLVEKNAQTQQQEQEQQERQRIAEEIAQIGKLNPEIQSVEDLARMPQAEFDAFKGYVDKGYTFLDSYRLSHFDQLANARAEAARNAAMNNARGKDHLTAIQNTGGAGALSVPAKEMALYRKLNPRASEAEIQKHWNKYKK